MTEAAGKPGKYCTTEAAGMISEGGLVHVVIGKTESSDLNVNQSGFNYHGAE